MIDYKCAYIKLMEDCNYALTLQAYFPLDGITYTKEDKPKTLEEAGGSWRDIADLGNEGWQLMYIATRNQYMVGLFTKDDNKYEINQIKSSLTTNQINHIVKEISNQFPKIETPKLEPFDISGSIKKFEDTINNFKMPIIPEIDLPTKDVNKSLLDLVNTINDIIDGFRSQISLLMTKLNDVPSTTVIAETIGQSIVSYCTNIIPPEKPIPPLPRLIYDGDGGPFCMKCGSSYKRKWFMKTNKCIQPECENYYDRFN